MTSFRDITLRNLKEGAGGCGDEPRLPYGIDSIVRVRHPIEPEPSDDWEIIESPTRYRKRFRLEDRGKILPFIELVLDYEDCVQHEGRITIDGTDVTIEVWTHDLDDVTERDHSYVANVDQIRQQVEQGYGDYADSDDPEDLPHRHEEFRDALNVGYGDESTAYHF